MGYNLIKDVQGFSDYAQPFPKGPKRLVSRVPQQNVSPFLS